MVYSTCSGRVLLFLQESLPDLLGPEGPYLLVARPNQVRDYAEDHPDQRQFDRRPSRRDEDVDPAHQRNDAWHRVEPLVVRTPQVGLPAAKYDERADPPDELNDDRDRDQGVQYGLEREQGGDCRNDPHHQQRDVGEAQPRVQPAERAEEQVVPGGVVGKARPTKQARVDRGESRRDDQNGDDHTPHVAPHGLDGVGPYVGRVDRLAPWDDAHDAYVHYEVDGAHT